MQRARTIIKQQPLFSVHAITKAGISYTWNFIQEDSEALIFVGKTLLEEKNKFQKHTSINMNTRTSKPQFVIETNSSFPQYEYAYLSAPPISSSKVEVRNCPKRPKQKTFAWFSNIVPLLLAIEHKDSLLATEIFHKKAPIFMQFPTTTIKLLESIAVEGLFSWIWGRFDEEAKKNLHAIFEGKCTKKIETWDVSETFFTAARRRLDIKQPLIETLDECMMRYLKTHPGTKITLGIVGSKHYRWVEKNLYSAQEKNITGKDLFSKAKTSLEAETENQYDKNAIALYFKSPEKSASEQATVSGYIRKSGAELLRKALPNKTHFASRLSRLGYLQGGATGIVVEVIV